MKRKIGRMDCTPLQSIISIMINVHYKNNVKYKDWQKFDANLYSSTVAKF